jgi:hypothetical protein
MSITVLHVPDCPGAVLLRHRLGLVLGDALGAQVAWQVITGEDQARQRGMTGSPTLLVHGVDPSGHPGQEPSVSCRLYRHDDGRLGPAPSFLQLHAVLTPDLCRVRSPQRGSLRNPPDAGVARIWRNPLSTDDDNP